MITVDLTTELPHAGPYNANREAEPRAPFGFVCHDFTKSDHARMHTDREAVETAILSRGAEHRAEARC